MPCGELPADDLSTSARERRGITTRADELRTCQSGHAAECSTTPPFDAPISSLPTLRFGPCIGRVAASRLAFFSRFSPEAAFSSQRRLCMHSKRRFPQSRIVRPRKRSSTTLSRRRRKTPQNPRGSVVGCLMSTAIVCSKSSANRIFCSAPSRMKQNGSSYRLQRSWSGSARMSRVRRRSCSKKRARQRRQRADV